MSSRVPEQILNKVYIDIDADTGAIRIAFDEGLLEDVLKSLFYHDVAKISRVTVLATTEFSHTFQDGTKGYKIKVEDSRVSWRYGFNPGDTAVNGDFYRQGRGSVLEKNLLAPEDGRQIFLRLDSPADIIIEEWS